MATRERMANLAAHALAIRRHRAQHKAIAPGPFESRGQLVEWVAQALEHDWFATMPIGDLLDAVPRWGPDRVQRLLGPLMIRWSRPIGELTERQRDVLLDALAQL